MPAREKIIYWSSIFAFTFIPLLEGWLMLVKKRTDMDWIFLITYLAAPSPIWFSKQTRDVFKRFFYGEDKLNINNTR
ncbi:MAG: hypothetical protein QM730_02785 [Anaerolineales bacterium]